MNKRILLLTVAAVMVVMLAMLVAPAYALNGNAINGCIQTSMHTLTPRPLFCIT